MKHLWWQTGVIYQIYPRSFQDSNGDGIGDLKGIIKRLDYLKWLGINAIWISPIYPSPMADFGYDISDYQGIHPLFGNMDDFDELLQEVRARGMKLILDLVPNHTSDQHPWFLESKSSRNNPKRDWYIWKDAKEDGSLPNNWLSVFGGSAWEWDETTGQYYYHAFLKEQPDLNWRNPDDQQHMATYEQLLPVYSTDQPEVHDIVKKMRHLLDKYAERMMIGEIYLPIHKLVSYYGVENSGAHLPFNFMLISIPWDARLIAAAIDEYEGALPDGGWPNWVLGNHDQPRITSRVGIQQAKVAAMLLLTLRGTPTIYYGDEIGMRDVPIPFHEVQDPQGLNMPDKNLSRDPARTPMQWNNDVNAGFTESKPWLRLDKSFTRQNVQLEKDDPYSMLSFYRRLIQLRQSEPSLMIGNYAPVYSDHQVIAFKRSAENSPQFMIVLNLTHRPCYFRPGNNSISGTIALATTPELEGITVADTINLSGDEGVIVQLDTTG